jgi:hypothetical protein
VSRRDEAPETLTVRPEHLRLIRSFRVEWSWCEAGAPRLLLLPPEATDADLLAAVRQVTGPWLVADESTLVPIYREAMLAATAFVNHAELALGLYEYESPLTPSRMAAEPFAKSGCVEIRGGSIRLNVTREHLALLKRANVRFFDDGGLRCEAAVDPKRPYGDKSYLYADMGEILGVEPEGGPCQDGVSLCEFTEAQLLRFDDLHHTIQPALQILVQRAELRQDRFERMPPGYGRWMPV